MEALRGSYFEMNLYKRAPAGAFPLWSHRAADPTTPELLLLEPFPPSKLWESSRQARIPSLGGQRGLLFLMLYMTGWVFMDHSTTNSRGLPGCRAAVGVSVGLLCLLTFIFQPSASKQINKAKEHTLKDNPCTFLLELDVWLPKAFRGTRKEFGFIALAQDVPLHIACLSSPQPSEMPLGAGRASAGSKGLGCSSCCL